MMRQMQSKVTAALMEPPKGETPSGTLVKRPKLIGMTTTEMSMITVPATVGVIIRRNRESLVERINWKRDEITTRVASMAGPPCLMAEIEAAVKVPEVPMRRIYPEPTLPTRRACKIVLNPLTARAVKVIQDA